MNIDIDNEFGLLANGIEAMRAMAMAPIVVSANLKRRAPLGRRSQNSGHMHRAMPCTWHCVSL